MIFVYLGPFLLLAAVPVLFYTVGHGACLLVIAALLLSLLAAEAISTRGTPPRPRNTSYSFAALPVLYVLVQVGITFWALLEATRGTALAFISLMLAVGVTTGVFGMLAAHELVHRKDRASRALGTLMLSTMCYRHFRIAHVYGHHRHAGTERDAATARLGENFYAFFLRTLGGQAAEAWRFERRRCERTPNGFFANRVHQDAALMLLVVAALYWLTGWGGVIFFAGESLTAILMLELFNYIAHYGLVRRIRPSGQVEPFGERHAWNSSNALANTLIFNMGRHTDHHRRAFAPYHELHYFESAPELPAGYAGSILIALVPPLWRRIMDPAVSAHSI